MADEGPPSYQKQPLWVASESSQHSLHYRATRGSRFLLVLHHQLFFFLLLPTLLGFYASFLKILEQPFNMLILQIWSLFFIVFFLSWVIYKIGMFFQCHPPLVILSLKFGSHYFDCYLFCLRLFFKLI